MPRLFTAIEIPDALRSELKALHLPLPGARWVKPEDYHLTLRFAGDINNTVAREFAANLAGIVADAFALRVSGVGTFGSHDPRAVWAGIEPSAALDTLARAHERAARNAGLEPEKRSFKAHVTLAHLKNSNPQAVASYLSRYAAYRSEPFAVTNFVLMSSKPVAGGGPYVTEERFQLQAGAWAQDDDNVAW